MSQELSSLRTENKSLKEEVKGLQLLFSKKNDTNEKDSKISFGELLTIHNNKPETALGSKVKAAGVTLLIILFSFGLFFNNFGPIRSHLPPRLVNLVNIEREKIPDVLPPASVVTPMIRKLKVYDTFIGGSNSKQKSIPESQSNTHFGSSGTTSTTAGVGTTTSTSRSSTHYHNIETVSSAEKDSLSDFVKAKRDDQSPINVSLQQSKSGIESPPPSNSTRKLESIGKSIHDGDINSIFLSEFANESSSTNDSESSELVQWFNRNINVKPNTAYLACNDVQQITPVNSPPIDSGAPFYVSFLVPTNASKSSQNDDNLVMEITCQVMDISIRQGFKEQISLDA